MTLVTGVVVAFDDHRGYGTVHADDGRNLFFHCSHVADGTRTIAVGTRVVSQVAPGHLGRWEATGLTPVAD